jgi:hypothetical protein
VLNLSPQMIGRRHPTRYNSHVPPLQHPSEHGRQLLVDCCLSSSNGGQLRPEPGVSLYFLMCLHLAPQTGKLAIAPPNPTTGALRWTIGSRGAIGWGHRYSAHGEREGKAGGGRVAAAHFGCCVLCCVLWLLQARFCYLTGRKSWDRASQNGQFFHIHNKNALLDAPNVNGFPKSVSSLDFGKVLTFGLKRDIGALWVRKKRVIFYPGRVPSYFFFILKQVFY